METAEDILRLADAKKQNLQKMFGQLESQASTALSCTRQWKDIEDDLVTVKNILMKQAQTLDLRERRVVEMEVSVDRRVQELETKMLNTSCEIDSKRKELDGIEKSLQERKEQLDLEQKRLDSIRVLVQESKETYQSELHMKLIEFASLDESIKARSEDFNAVTKSIEDQRVLFRSKEKELASLQLSIEECKKVHKSLNEQGSPRAGTSAPTSRSAGNLPGTGFVSEQVKIERPEPIMDPLNHVSSNDQSEEAPMASLLTDYHVPGYGLMHHDVLSAFQLSQDQPGFVLGLMLEYYSEPTGFDESVMRNIVLLLEKLMEISPTITPQLKKEASKLALAWKTKLTILMEVLAFLLFLAVYGLASYFGRDEILMFAGAVAHQKQAPEICRALGFADKMDEFIKNLEMGKQYMEAARFSCAFGLIDKFPLDVFFEQHLKNVLMDARKSINASPSPEAKREAFDKQIGAMKSILECVADYKINAAFLVSNLTKGIAEKENEKEKLQAPAPALPMVRPGEDGSSFRIKRRR